MSEKKKIWDYLQINKEFTLKELVDKTHTSYLNARKYLNILKKANYLNHDRERIGDNDKILCVKHTGKNHPTYSNGTLSDSNTNKQYEIHKDKSKSKFKSVLKFYLQAILNLNKEEIVSSEINNEFFNLWGYEDDAKTKVSSATAKYKKLLIEKGYMKESGNFYRNSSILLINLLKINEYYLEIKDKKIYGKEK